MNVFIVPYTMGSESARVLAERLNARLSTGEKRFIKDKTLVINWGNSSLDVDNVLHSYRNKLLNHPNSVGLAANKIKTFHIFELNDVPTVEWTTKRDIALGWIDENGYVYARTNPHSSQGEGISVVTIEDTLPNAPLYTKAVPKAYEYRVHIFKGEVIDFTRKRRRTDTEVNPYIKNFNKGWVFCREGVELPDTVRDAALKANKALRLDFCALDILYRQVDDEAYVLEANTAIGIEGTTLDKYVECFKKEMQWE